MTEVLFDNKDIIEKMRDDLLNLIVRIKEKEKRVKKKDSLGRQLVLMNYVSFRKFQKLSDFPLRIKYK